MRNRQDEPGCLKHLAIMVGIVALVALMFYLAMRNINRDQAAYAAHLAKFERQLVTYASLLQEAAGDMDPAGPYRTGKMVILDEHFSAPNAYTLRGMGDEKTMAADPAEVGSLVLVSVQDFTLARPAYRIHGARYIQSAVIQVVDAATGRLTAQGTVWTKAAGWWADPIGQPGVGPPRPFKAKIKAGGKEVWNFLESLPDRGSSGLVGSIPLPAAEPALRFDGLYTRSYRGEEEYLDTNDYYRFYPDGRVTFIHVQARTTPAEAAAMMAAGEEDSLSANYTLKDGVLEFALVNWTETKRFSGMLKTKSLVLLQKWHVEGLKHDPQPFVFVLPFIEMPEIAP